MPEPASGHPPVDLRIQLLGGFSITIGERQIDAGQFRLRKSRSLIKLLALAPNHRLQRDQLLEMLWPDQDLHAAANSFYQVLYEARRVLDPFGANPHHYLQLHEEVLSLCPDFPPLVDAEAFKAAANRAFRTQDQAAYQAALAVYPGDLLPDDIYEDWSNAVREALHQDHRHLLIGLAKLLENQKEYLPAIETLKQALISDALDEEANAGLMRLYVRTGQRQLALRQYQLFEEILQRELDAPPDPSITHLYQEILSGRYSPAETPFGDLAKTRMPSSPPNNLPVQMTSFVGRMQEKATIRRLLSPRMQAKRQPQVRETSQVQTARLVTLTGAGGCGKTRLALETANELLENYPDGIWLVELAGLSAPDLVPQMLVSALRIQNSSGQPLPSILSDFLKHKHLLLVLDNCEHLVEACARLAELLLKSCPYLQILVTSQEILGLPGEVSYSVSPLSLPDPLHLLPTELTSQSEAVRLFVERASYALPGFSLNENNAPAVVKICQRLDGIPLAIELAAARVKMMQVEEIAALLEKSFDLLTGGSRTALPRYQSLHASIDWSYNLLSEPERLLFRRLAVFAGSWNMDEARFIASGDAISREPEESSQFPEDVLELLTLLVNKSLVTSHQLPGAPTRYFFLDTIRRFALDRLKETGEELLMRNRHLDYYELLGSRLEPLLRGPDMVTTLTSLEADHDNLRTALEWSLATDLPAQFERSSRTNVEKGLRLVGDLVWFWVLLFIADEGIMWAKRLLAAEVIERGLQPLNPLRDLARARALYMIGWYGDGESAQSQKYMEESLRILKELGSVGRRDAAYALNALAEWTLGSGEYERAKALANESLALFREVGDLPGLTMVLGSPFASLAMNQGDFDLARKYMDEALAINQKLGDMDGVAEGYRRLGELAALEGNCRQAWTLLENAHELYCRLGNKLGIYFTLVQMGKAALAQGDAKHAEAIFAEALDLARQVGALSQMSASMATLGKAAFVQGQYERASQWYRQAIETAREIEDNRALACALRGLAEVNQAGGDAASALRLYQESLEVWGELVDRREIYRSLEALAALVVDLGQPELSLRLFAATQDLYNSIRFSFSPRHQDMHSNKLNSLKSQLGEAAFNAAWSQGQAMELEQAIETALSFSIS